MHPIFFFMRSNNKKLAGMFLPTFSCIFSSQQCFHGLFPLRSSLVSKSKYLHLDVTQQRDPVGNGDTGTAAAPALGTGVLLTPTAPTNKFRPNFRTREQGGCNTRVRDPGTAVCAPARGAGATPSPILGTGTVHRKASRWPFAKDKIHPSERRPR